VAPAAAGATSRAPAAATLLWNGRLDLNLAGAEDLAALPGIGPVRAGRIVAARAARGGRFATVDDLLDVPGIGRATLARLRPHVQIGEAPP
jgi:competence protein ComEA